MTDPPSLPSLHTRYQLHGWIVSLVLHAGGVVLASVFVTALHIEPQPAPFRWDVTVVDSMSVSESTTAASAASPTSSPPPASIPRRFPQVDTQIAHPVAEPDPIPPAHAEPVETVHSEQVQPSPRPEFPSPEVVSTLPREVTSTVSPVDPPPQPSPILSRPDETIAPTSMESPPPVAETSAPEDPVETASRSAESAPEPTAEASLASEGEPRSLPIAPIAQAPVTPSATAMGAIAPPSAVEQTAPHEHSSAQPLIEPATHPMPDVTTSSALAITAPPIDSETSSHASTSTGPAAGPQVARIPPSQGSTGESSAPPVSTEKPDYSWLAHDLMSRIEQMIHYPVEARLNQWQGKVVVRVVVRADGEIESLRLVQTSGHTVLDEEALALLRRLSPLTLDRPLGKERIPLQVPIRYSLK